MKQRIEQLRSQINHHNHLYHVLNKPEITDQQFDIMFEKLLELERDYPEHTDPNSPTQRVGSDLAHNLPRMPHPSPMLSIQSFYEPDKLLRAIATSVHDSASAAKQPETETETATETTNFFLSPKYDGIAIELTYQNGELKHALTRGNGNTGGNVTPNARTIKQIPLTIAGANLQSVPLIIRGEVYVTQAQLKKINRARKKEKKEPYPNCRAAAASLLKAKRSSTTAAAKLSAVFFYVHDTAGTDLKSVPLMLSLLNSLHLPTPETHTANTPEQALQIAEQIAATQYPFPTDGAVIKAKNTEQYGYASAAKQPGAWAYKPNNAVWETTCRFVSYTVAKTGKVTPLVHFMPFTHNGTDFNKAVISPQLAAQLQPRQTLHIQITGGIIPKVIKPEARSTKHEATSGTNCPPAKGDEERQRRRGSETETAHCPFCHQPLNHKNRCTNTAWCPAFGHTAETVKQHTGWKYEFPVFKHTDGYGIYIAAIQGHNATLVQREPRKHDMVILTDTLDTAGLVGVTIGQLHTGPFTWDDEP